MNRVTVGRENEVDRDAARPHAAALPRGARAAAFRTRVPAAPLVVARNKWHVARF